MENKKIPVCSFFNKPITNTLPDTIPADILEIYHFIKGETMQKVTNQLRAISDIKQARKFKAENFCYATFSGVFTKRNEDALVQHSGLMAIDFDHLKELKSIKYKLIDDPQLKTVLLFVSPSGDGLKWIIEVDLSDCTHKEYFTAVCNYVKHTYGLEADKSGKDVARACFLPHDKEIYINSEYLKI